MTTQGRNDADPRRAALLDFWFGPEGSAERGRERPLWWEVRPEVDAEIRRRFLDLHEAAASGALDGWAESPEGALALTIALDQLPRNMFRGSPRAYDTDGQARSVAEAALARGHDKALPFVMAQFFYLPLMHSEALEDQQRCLALYRARPDGANGAEWARRHLEVIERFGRFPHRNAVLGRPSTPEELAFLAQPGSSF